MKLDSFNTYKIYVYEVDRHGNPAGKPFPRDVVARNITEAVDKLVRALDEDTFLCPDEYGNIWYRIEPNLEN